MLGQHIVHHAIGLVELTDFTERTVGYEVDRVLTILNRHIHRKLPQGIGRVEGDQPATTVSLDLPSGSEPAGIWDLA